MSRTWVNGGPPYLNETNLNGMETDIAGKQSAATLDADVTAKATTGGTALNTALSTTYAPVSGSANYTSPTQAAGISVAMSVVFGG